MNRHEARAVQDAALDLEGTFIELERALVRARANNHRLIWTVAALSERDERAAERAETAGEAVRRSA